jgi:hypothetical protein
LHSIACFRPKNAAKSLSNWAANRPVVSQKSSDASTSERISSASNTLPATGTLDSPGMNASGAKAWA